MTYNIEILWNLCRNHGLKNLWRSTRAMSALPSISTSRQQILINTRKSNVSDCLAHRRSVCSRYETSHRTKKIWKICSSFWNPSRQFTSKRREKCARLLLMLGDSVRKANLFLNGYVAMKSISCYNTKSRFNRDVFLTFHLSMKFWIKFRPLGHILSPSASKSSKKPH